MYSDSVFILPELVAYVVRSRESLFCVRGERGRLPRCKFYFLFHQISQITTIFCYFSIKMSISFLGKVLLNNCSNNLLK